MKTVDFYNKIKTIIKSDNRYLKDSYEFVNDAVIFTVEKHKKDKSNKHITGRELLNGIIEYATKKYGPVACLVFHEWGINDGEDIGNIVFNMVRCNLLSTSENDSIEDFKNYEDFNTAISRPFTPKNKTADNFILPIIA